MAQHDAEGGRTPNPLAGHLTRERPAMNLRKALLWIARQMLTVSSSRRGGAIAVTLMDRDTGVVLTFEGKAKADSPPPWIQYLPAPDPKISLFCDDQERIIRAIKDARPDALQVAQLVEATGIERSKMSTLLNSLKKRGCVISVEPNGVTLP